MMGGACVSGCVRVCLCAWKGRDFTRMEGAVTKGTANSVSPSDVMTKFMCVILQIENQCPKSS